MTGQAPAWEPEPYAVSHVVDELPDTVSFGLLAPDGAALAEPQPGQFNMLWMFGVGEVPISVSGIPDGDTPMLHTVRAVGAVTAALCALREGDVVGVRGPFGTTWSVDEWSMREPACDLVIVAGGLGLAPLRPVVEQAARHIDRFGRVVLLEGARSPGLLLYARELDGWRDAGIDVRTIVDCADASWTGPIGVVTRLLDDAIGDPRETFVMVCGPEVMMRFVSREVVSLGVPADQVEVSLERNMACGMGLCGHCQLGELLMCRDGPVVRLPAVDSLMRVPEL